MMGLTPKQAELLAFLRSYMARNGYAPSYSDMMAGIGTGSRGHVAELMDCLEECGCIRRLPRRARAIEIIDRPDARTSDGYRLRFIPVPQEAA